jgi:ELWxxDGT repeat protein
MNRQIGVILTVALTSSLSAVGLNVGTVAAAGPLPYMVEDIRSGGHSSNPSDLTAIGNLLYFTASDGKHGREPWISDGTPSGTHLIKNISPGSYSSNANGYTLVGNDVFFTAQDGSGRELWKTDGTAAGTVRVKDIRPGRKSSKPAELTALGNTLYLSANDGPHGQELWKSDGTEAGTVLVADIDPGRYGSVPMELTAYENAVYFVAHFHVDGNVDGPCCATLHRSDGSSAGTGQVLDLNGESILLPSNLTRAGSFLYFAALDASSENRLWRTNGTAVGTRHLSPVMYAEQLTDVAGTLFFIASPEYEGDPSGLWKSDGTRAGTNFIKSVDNPSQLTAVGNNLFYTTLDGDGEQCLRVSDGVARASDSWSCAYWNNGYAWGNLTNVGGTLYLTFGSNDDPSHQLGWALYYVDCTQYTGGCAEYSWLKSVVPHELRETWTVQDHDLTAVGGSLYYAGADYNELDGVELWAFSPTATSES